VFANTQDLQAKKGKEKPKMKKLERKFPETISVVVDPSDEREGDSVENLLAYKNIQGAVGAVDDEGSTVAKYQLVHVRKFRKEVAQVGPRCEALP
jgi:hypothetical protein